MCWSSEACASAEEQPATRASIGMDRKRVMQSREESQTVLMQDVRLGRVLQMRSSWTTHYTRHHGAKVHAHCRAQLVQSRIYSPQTASEILLHISSGSATANISQLRSYEMPQGKEHKKSSCQGDLLNAHSRPDQADPRPAPCLTSVIK